ncbi:hypothetical protein [Pseudohongiella sp.]|uniref:Sulfatase N-terminal domain-containing protein n=1 Tax=marine sediment metagenome TaxID=412755 RepID=A0A0F9VVB3_9ZZZZ|nr:hypothetical protein [Pseudohongiella sp.]HDZ07988.1 hypothetical protein [Pseudohongiella sp.]HEA64169.1 hypothetical protein [Pseudohongiella sp.]
MMDPNLRYRPDLRFFLTMIAFIGLFVALTLPNRLAWINPPAFIFLPLEFMMIGLLLLVPGRAGDVCRWLLTLLLGLGILLRGADLVTHEIFARPFNLVFDSHLLADGSRLLTGVLGDFAALAVGFMMAVAAGLLCWLAYVMLRRIQHALRSAPRLSGGALLALLLVGLILDSSGWRRTGTFAWDQLVLHGQDTIYSVRDIREFAAIVNEDEWADRSGAGLFDRLQGKDVFIVFAESYGRALLEREPFADSIRATLLQAQSTLEADGVHMRSAFLTSPTVGGLSWLAHASALSGAWIDSETRYESLVISRRATLNRLFRDAGWRTVAAMPAISMAWPEGNYYGYDQIYHANNFGYQGLPFNWVTMPDQYVWSALHGLERGEGIRRPVMAELALISSHAPWTPVARLLPWDEIGDGQVFNAQAQAGLSPEEVWAEVDSIRDHYRQSIEYMLQTLVSYVQEYGDEDLVIMVLGDHPAAPFITGDSDDKQVPVHLIAHDPAVIEAIKDWQWQPGLLPDGNAPVWRMDRLRDRFVDAFSASRQQELK